MVYFKTLRQEAWKETWELVLESPFVTFLLGVAIFGFTVLFTYLWKEEKDVIELLIDAAIGLLSTGIVFLFVFLLHLFYLSPRRLYLEEKAEKDKAIATLVPPIAGTWTREIYAGCIGVLTLEMVGFKLTGAFKEGDVDHALQGEYDPINRQFNYGTERTHRNNPLVPRYLQPEEKVWMIGNNRLYFENPKNALGQFEHGFFKRKGT